MNITHISFIFIWRGGRLNMKLLSIMPDLPKEILGSRENEHVDVTVFYFWSQDCSYCKQWPQFVESVNAQFGSRLHCVVVHVGELSNEKRIDSELVGLLCRRG